ncbi:amino acid transporter [Devosia sp. 919]|uniref:amino acid transporter n=1 Tax=Devosia sp. 919 TaxID=2726065 RepID=UPI001556DDF8|nr:amino acid transporter [Devosia sp. 919]
MSKLVRNEQRKLTATYMNGVPMALVGIGALAPIVALAQSSSGSPTAAFVVVGCFISSLGLHWLARRHLKGLEE